MDVQNRTYRFDNGLVLLMEEMDWIESFAICASVPAGAVRDPLQLGGLASLTCEMTNRGAGGRNNRSFLETLEYLGLDSAESASLDASMFVSTGLVDVWEQAYELMADQILRPMLDEGEFDECRATQLQEIAGLEDDPGSKLTLSFMPLILPLRRGRPKLGTRESLESIKIEDVRKFHSQYYQPQGAVIAIAGRIDWERAKELTHRLFDGWTGDLLPDDVPVEPTENTSHVERATAQTHLRVGFRGIPFGHPDYWRASAAVDVLSGGMSSRLFTEVREKRGLCYSVDASLYTSGPYGWFECSCGTVPENAQQSLDVIVREIDRLSEGRVTQDELERYKILRKSSIVMQRESAKARAGAMITDWRFLNRIRSLEERLELCDSMTCDMIDEYCAAHPRRKFKLATLGPEPLELPEDRLGVNDDVE